MNLTQCRTILVYGGSFDPPHLAHVLLPMLAMEHIGADAVAYIPAGRAPHKPGRTQSGAHHRLTMLRLALEQSARAVVLTDEIDRSIASPETPSFTIDTLDGLRARLGPTVNLRLLIGADMVRIFETWREHKRIMELASPLAMVRPPDTRESLLAALPDDASRNDWRARLVETPLLDISSTLIRDRAQKNLSLAGLVSPRVEDYIVRHGLYRK